MHASALGDRPAGDMQRGERSVASVLASFNSPARAMRTASANGARSLASCGKGGKAD